jgi:toxin ParE1/3/4
MYDVELTQTALRHLVEIAIYTRQNWGERKADTYLSELKATLATLREFPSSYQLLDDIRPGTRRMLAGSHACYFEITGRKVRVLAIIHVRQEPDLPVEPS